MSFQFLAALALSLSAAPNDADWPQWRGPKRDGHSLATGLLKKWPQGGPTLVFKTDKIGAGYGSPAVMGGKLFILGAEDATKGDKEFVLCLDSNTGKEIWRTPIETQPGNYLFDRGNGPRTTPTIDGDTMYVLGAKGDLVALKLADGKKTWSKNLVADFGGGIPTWGYSESVLIDGDRLIVTPGKNKGAMIALNKGTGEPIWRCADLTDDAGYSSAVAAEVAGVRHYIQQTQKGTCGVRASDGRLLWRVEDTNYRVAVIPTPVVHQDHVFATSGYGAGCKLIKLIKDGDGIRAETIYKSKVIVNHHGGVVRVGDHLYGHSDREGWVCLPFMYSGDADGPKPEWTSKKLDKGSVTYADGHLYCYGEVKGDVALVKADPKDWIEVGRFTIPEKSTLRRNFPNGGVWAHPVIANGKLYLREFEWLFCYDLTDRN